MSHFSDEQWADFARGASETEQHARIQPHLDRGCAECSAKLRLWSTVSRLAGRERSYRPPDGAIEQVRRLYAQHKPQSLLGRASKAVSLLFDNLRAPLPVGVRAAGPPSRLLVYGDGRRMLRLRIEKQGDSESLSLVGQVSQAEGPPRELPTLPVLVQSRSKTVTQTVTNRFGEFELELQPATNLRLVVGVPRGDALAVLLPLKKSGRARKVEAKHDSAKESKPSHRH